jgi:hypothetical protein
MRGAAAALDIDESSCAIPEMFLELRQELRGGQIQQRFRGLRLCSPDQRVSIFEWQKRHRPVRREALIGPVIVKPRRSDQRHHRVLAILQDLRPRPRQVSEACAAIGHDVQSGADLQVAVAAANCDGERRLDPR